MKSKFLKRTTALLLCMVMVLSSGFKARADETTTDQNTETVVAKGVVAEETVTEEVTTEEVTTEEVTTEEAVTEEVTTEEVVTGEVVTEEVTAEGVVAEKTVTEEATTEEAVTEEVVTDEVTTEKVVTEEVKTEEAAANQVVVQETTQSDDSPVVEERYVELVKDIDGITITLRGPESSFEPDKEYTLSVAKIENKEAVESIKDYEVIEDEAIIEAVEKAIDKVAEEKEKCVTNYQAYDIKLMADGEEVQPLGPVEVTFSGKEVAQSVADEKTEVNVIHVDEVTAVPEDMAAIAEQQEVVIETTHFSIYVYVEMEDVGEITLTVEHRLENYVDSEEYIEYGNTEVVLPNGFRGTLEGLVSMCLSDEAEKHHSVKAAYLQDENKQWKQVESDETLNLTEDTTIRLDYKIDEGSLVPLERFLDVSTVKIATKIEKNKTAAPLDENDQTKVTLQVGGDQEQLGVDIVYIVGSYASNADGTPNVEGDVLISSLVDAMTEIVESGVPVNFGMVPFSSDNVVAMPLTTITEDNLSNLNIMITEALATCEALYDGVNMENALIKCKKMFNESELADHPERQHLVMISSGFTYFFNSGENNEYASTVPVNYVGTKNLWYWNKAWQRARTNQTNTYPIPRGIVEAHEKAVEEGITNVGLWDFYWSYIDQWSRADIAAGDEVVYEACTIESANFLKWFNSGILVSGFTQTSYGKAIPNTTDEDIAKAVTLAAGENPLVVDRAAHAIGYERAMWEAYEYAKANFIHAGINFYPIYNALNANYTNGNWSPSSYGVNWTNQYIGHSFVDMLAGGEGQAVMYDKEGDKTFFDPIREQLLYSCSIGSVVEDYIGYDSKKGNFEFIQDASAITLNIGDKVYSTTKLDTPNPGATSSYTFTAPGAQEATFTLDYYYGNGTTTEKFIWTFGENISKYVPVSLAYKLQLTEKSKVSGDYIVDTNISATLYPKNSDGEDGNPEIFPIPNVTYSVRRNLFINKVSSANPNTWLAGAKFTLMKSGTTEALTFVKRAADIENGEDEDTNYYTYAPDGTSTELETGANGKIVIEGLNSEVYHLTEIKAPEGYILSTLELAIDLSVDEENENDPPVTTSDGNPYTQASETEDGTAIEITIQNAPEYELPSTGSSGIYWYIISGMVLMMGASLMLYKKKWETPQSQS